MAVGGDGQIWVTEGLTTTIDRIDPTTGNIFVSATPEVSNLQQLFAPAGSGVNRIFWTTGSFEIYLWPGIWPAD